MTTSSSAAAHAFGIFGFLASPLLALYADHHYRLPFLFGLTILCVLVSLLWYWLLPKATHTTQQHQPILLPPSLVLGAGPERLYCDHEGIRLGPDALVAASPFRFNEDMLIFQKNRYEMFISWTEIAAVKDLNPHEGSLQLVYTENPYKSWLAFQPSSPTQEELRLLKAFIRQGGKNPVN